MNCRLWIADCGLSIRKAAASNPKSPIPNPQSPSSLLVLSTGDGGLDFLDDLRVHAGLEELLADADGVLDRAAFAAAVADEAVAIHAQQRRAAVLLPVV